MRLRKDLILVFGLLVSPAGIATTTEGVQPPAAVPPAPEAAAPAQAPVAPGVVAPDAPVAPAAPIAPTAPVATTAPVAGAPAAPAAAAAAVDENPMICKRITETGTLGRKKKICMTAKQWEVQREAARGTMRRIDAGAGSAGPAGTPSSGG
jgi:hypothetical protein